MIGGKLLEKTALSLRLFVSNDSARYSVNSVSALVPTPNSVRRGQRRSSGGSRRAASRSGAIRQAAKALLKWAKSNRNDQTRLRASATSPV